VVLAGTETHEALGRVVNALELAKELQEHNDDVQIIFDGAGTEWIPVLEDESHDVHPLYASVKDSIYGVCQFCAKAFGVFKAVKKSGISLLDEYDQHPSLRRFIADGYQIVTF
jgi:hypothetical protein